MIEKLKKSEKEKIKAILNDEKRLRHQLKMLEHAKITTRERKLSAMIEMARDQQNDFALITIATHLYLDSSKWDRVHYIFYVANGLWSIIWRMKEEIYWLQKDLEDLERCKE